jgi:hypothetical protein
MWSTFMLSQAPPPEHPSNNAGLWIVLGIIAVLAWPPSRNLLFDIVRKPLQAMGYIFGCAAIGGGIGAAIDYATYKHVSSGAISGGIIIGIIICFAIGNKFGKD